MTAPTVRRKGSGQHQYEIELLTQEARIYLHKGEFPMLFRAVISATLLLSGAIAGFAQVPGPNGHDVIFFNEAFPMPPTIGPGPVPGRLPNEVVETVKAALNLSDVQVTALKALLELHNQTNQQIFQEMQEAQRKLQEVMAENNPNPTDIGNAFLATRAAEQRLQAAGEKFRSDFQSLLNADQRTRLSNLQTESGQIEALRMLGVIGGPGPSGIPRPLPPLGLFGGAVGVTGGPVPAGPPPVIQRTIRIQRPD